MKHVKEIEKGKVYLIDFRDSEGKRWRKKIHGTKKYAVEVATRLMKEKEDDVFFPERRTLKVTYGQLADAYWELHGKELPGRSAKSMWKICKDKFGNVKMKDLTSTKLQQFYNELLTKGGIKNKGLKAGLDVYETEPKANDNTFDYSPYQWAENLYGTHHIGASTDQAQDAVAECTVQIINQYAQDGTFLHRVN